MHSFAILYASAYIILSACSLPARRGGDDFVCVFSFSCRRGQHSRLGAGCPATSANPAAMTVEAIEVMRASQAGRVVFRGSTSFDNTFYKALAHLGNLLVESNQQISG